jgi:hypothetical protein
MDGVGDIIPTKLHLDGDKCESIQAEIANNGR